MIANITLVHPSLTETIQHIFTINDLELFNALPNNSNQLR